MCKKPRKFYEILIVQKCVTSVDGGFGPEIKKWLNVTYCKNLTEEKSWNTSVFSDDFL